MYHTPRMCRTCLQMSRGDFKFVSLDSVDPLWNSNSPNLKEQLISIVPEMKIEDSGAYICTSCFIALRTAYEFKMMCQATEEKFQSHNYKYRRPFGVGPGSTQFHVALNDISDEPPTIANFRCQNLNYLQADTSIDITEHHLYDASKITRQQLSTNIINNVTQKLPEIDMEVIIPERSDENRSNGTKKLDSLELRKKYNIGSEISILKNENKNDTMMKKPFSLMMFLRENSISPDALNCNVRLRVLTSNYVRFSTKGRYSLSELKQSAIRYYFDKLEQYLTCRFCTKSFSTRIGLQMHEEMHAPTKQFTCSHCDVQFLLKESLKRHLYEYHNVTPPIPPAVRIKTELKLPESIVGKVKVEEVDSIKISDQTTLIILKPEQNHTRCEKKNSSELIERSHQVSIKPRFTEQKIRNSTKSLQEIRKRSKFNCNAFSEQLSNSIKEHITKSKTADRVIVKQEFITPLKTSTPIRKMPTPEIEDLKAISRSIIVNKGSRFGYVDYYKCLICNKVCRNKMQLTKHQNFLHIPSVSSKYWPSVISNIRMKRKTNRNYCLRLRTRQPDYITPFRCNICDKRFSEENFLNLHMYCHIPVVFAPETLSLAEDGPEIFTCYLCNKGFPRERYLKLHNLQVHLCKTTTCKTCRREFKSEFWFNRHRCQSVVETPVLPFVDKEAPLTCKLCNRTFAKSRFMKSHCRRMHPAIPLKDLIKFKESKNSENVKIGDLDLDDPMKLYTIAGSLASKGSKAEASSDVERPSDDSSNDSLDNTEEQEVDERNTDGKTEIDSNLMKINIKSETLVRNPLAIHARRKSIQRSMPKIQCDFCGDYIEENRYDNHIYEHNKIRFKKIPRKLEISEENTSLEDLEKNKVVLKCPICAKTFQRQFYLTSHINRHIKEEPNLSSSLENRLENCVNETSQMEEADKSENYTNENEEDEEDEEGEEGEGGEREEKPYEINLRIANTSDVYKCCEKTFKLKAHFFRHYKMRHGAYKLPNPTSNKLARIKKEYNEEQDEDNKSRYFTRRGLPKHYAETNDEENNQITKEPPTVNSNKRKSEDLNDSENEEIKKPKMEMDADYEFVKRKRIKSESEATMLCNKKQMRSSSPSNDLDSLSSKLSFKYQCLVCDKRFKQKCQLRDHSNVHTGAKPYICEFCIPPRGFTQTSSLYVHFRRVHTAIVKNCVWEVYSKNGACLICSEIFEKHAFMFQHVKEQYMEKAFKCHVCMKECNMVCHYKIHGINPEEMRLILMQANKSDGEEETEEDVDEDEEEENYETENEATDMQLEETCDSEMDSLGDYDKSEEVTDHLKCIDCDRTFTNKQQLRFHKKSLAHIQQVQSMKKQINSENENDNTVDPSEDLDAIADIKNNVKAIMKKINNMKYKKHKCPVCDMSFVKKIQLRKHKRKMHRAIHKRNARTEADEFNPDDEMSGPEETDSKSPERELNIDENQEQSNEPFEITRDHPTSSPNEMLTTDINDEEKEQSTEQENMIVSSESQNDPTKEATNNQSENNTTLSDDAIMDTENVSEDRSDDKTCSLNETSVKDTAEEELPESFEDEQSFTLSLESESLNNSYETLPTVSETNCADTTSIIAKEDDDLISNKEQLLEDAVVEDQINESVSEDVDMSSDSKTVDGQCDNDKLETTDSDINTKENYDDPTKVNHLNVSVKSPVEVRNNEILETIVSNDCSKSPSEEDGNRSPLVNSISNTEHQKHTPDSENNFGETESNLNVNMEIEKQTLKMPSSSSSEIQDSTCDSSSKVCICSSSASSDSGLDNITNVPPNPSNCYVENSKKENLLLDISKSDFNCTIEPVNEEKELVLEKSMSKIESLETLHVKDM
ncbi:hypothetical protein ILUMI_02248 [Ignelater luminosus]|uniref:Uncharacterized protein n=1 Tax=Ignelater luminosus TaxID=2038154 RepID=A0A8K0DIH0_IGNLU|nr:hypothetical protein ILUMI_02248 [Ignelater luminosus]